MNAAVKMLAIDAEPAKVSLSTSQLEPAGHSMTSARLGDPMRAGDELIQDRQPVTKKLSEVVRTFCRTREREKRIDLMQLMRQEARDLRRSFSAANFEVLANFTAALERWFTALARDVGAINSSSLKTLAHALDFLAQVTSSSSGHDEMERTPIRMLAVDDDPVCLRTLMMLASNNNGVRLIACDGVGPALRQLKTGDFDLIFSDILMPGMNGFEFVAELRKLPKHRATPVVFVTCLSDFETRSRSVLSGGCDLIAKPFTVGEVLVKALTLGLKRRFESAAAVAQVEGQAQEVRPNGAQQDSEAPSLNDGGNGPGTLEPDSFALKGLAARGVIVVEGHGGIMSVDSAAAELLGYSPGEAINGDIRVLMPDELQSEENKSLLSRAIAGRVKNQSGIKMTGRCKDNSTVQLLFSVSETWMQGRRAIICLLQAVSPTVAATEEVSVPAVGASPAPAVGASPGRAVAPAVDAGPVMTELASRIEQRNTTLAELIRAKEYWEGCAGERAALLEDLRNRLRGQDSTVENLRRETEALKGFCKARVAELEQTCSLLERQAKEHLERQRELQRKWGSVQAQVNSLTESLAKAAASRTAAEQQAIVTRAASSTSGRAKTKVPSVLKPGGRRRVSKRRKPAPVQAGARKPNVRSLKPGARRVSKRRKSAPRRS